MSRRRDYDQEGVFPPDDVLAEALGRITSPGWERFSAQLSHTGGCTRPVRLRGSLECTDLTTGELRVAYDTISEPDGVLLKACQARRATRCPACAAVYKADARQLILAGLVGGKGVSTDVVNRPLVFVTLTAPSFGPVHTAHSEPVPCHPSLDDCDCGRHHNCQILHAPDDPARGTPLCPATYDYRGTIMWNNRAGELWRRTVISARRQLAAYLGTATRSFNNRYRLAYLKVVEYQARGVVHVHALLRLDPAPGAEEQPSALDSWALVAAVKRAAATAAAPNPLRGAGPVRWGTSNRVDPVPDSGRPHLSAYVAKYTTKSVDGGGALDHRLARGELATLDVGEHLKRLVQTAWDLGGELALKGYRLRQWAHTLGYRGHWLTKSPYWSTTLGALRQARHDYQLGHAAGESHAFTIGRWTYSGSGHHSEGDAWLAEIHHENRRLSRRTCWEEQ